MFTTELKGEIRVLKNHTPLPTTPNMVTNEIERMVLRTVESLLPKQDTPDDTYITNPDLAVTVSMNLNSFIDNVTNTALATFKTAQTNELALKKISAASIALPRTVNLNKIEAEHKILQNKHTFISQ